VKRHEITQIIRNLSKRKLKATMQLAKLKEYPNANYKVIPQVESTMRSL
jgi:hypothetical protein